jgi:hypothetical protein
MRKAHNFKWTEAAIRAEAEKYASRVEFEAGCGSAVNAARKQHKGLLDELFPRLIAHKMTIERATEIALASLPCTRTEFQGKHKTAWACLWKNDLLDSVPFTPTAKGMSRFKWTEEAIRAEAAKYTCKGDFELFSRGASERARKIGIIDDLGLAAYPPSDNDSIYIWRAVDMVSNGMPVYKIGVTSARLGRQRIEQVAAASGIEAEVILLEKLSTKASVVEKKLLSLGSPVEIGSFNGASEFRAMSPAALDAALSVIIEAL